MYSVVCKKPAGNAIEGDKQYVTSCQSVISRGDATSEVFHNLMLLQESQQDVLAFAKLAKLIRMHESHASRSGPSVIGELMPSSTGPQLSSTSSIDAAVTNRMDFGRYKTELCRPFEETGSCKYGSKCQFAHGVGELRQLDRHPKYKTEYCRTFHTSGFCPYGPRCHFVHHENDLVSKAVTSSAKEGVAADKFLHQEPSADHIQDRQASGITPQENASLRLGLLMNLLSLIKIKVAERGSVGVCGESMAHPTGCSTSWCTPKVEQLVRYRSY